MGVRTGKPKGRPPGSQNTITRKREKAVAEVAQALGETIPEAFTGDAHAFLMAIYKDPAKEIGLRLDAAKAAIRYEKPAISAMTLTGPNGGPIEQIQRIERVIVSPQDSDT